MGREQNGAEPLIDLHLHLDGSLSLPVVRKIAASRGIAIPDSDEALSALLTVSPGCRDLNEYLEKFDFPCRLLQTAEALELAASDLLSRLAAQGLIYAEIRFAPQKHCDGGLTQEEAVVAVLSAIRDAPIGSGLILCCMRGRGNEAENRETALLAVRFAKEGVCGLDLAGAEALYPTSDYVGLLSEVKAAGVRLTVHAGEADGPESVRTALRLGADRIGHGVRAVGDPELLRELAERGTVLEICPTSNLQTAIYPDLARFPLPALLDAGVRVTVNTDNMTVSATTLANERENLRAAFGLTDAQMTALTVNAADGAFCDPETRAGLLEKIKNRAFEP